MKKLNLGCGEDIREGFDNVDIQSEAPIVWDLNKFPYKFARDNTYSYVWCKNILEHLREPIKVLNELWRLCKNNAEIEIIVPHYSNRSAYDGLDHCHYFSEIAFRYFIQEINTINKKDKFDIIELKVIPSLIGRLIKPYWLRERLSLFINGLQSSIHVRLRVIKTNK